MAVKCIICERETNGTAVKDDAVIGFIRWAKRMMRMAQNNRLVVCRDCMATHKAKREKFEKNLVQHIVLGGIIFLGLTLVPIFTKAGFSLGASLVGLLFFAGIVGLAVLSSYHPAVEGERTVGEMAAGKRAAEAKLKAGAKEKSQAKKGKGR
jgi:hypothetical protein